MPFSDLKKDLDARVVQGLRRHRHVLEGAQGTHVVVDGEPYLSFCSNDYLGLANHPRLITALQQGAQRYGVGAGASHLVSGHSCAHHELEEVLAAFAGKPAALFLSSGYLANLGMVQALAGRGDTVFADKLNHASLNDAVQLSRAVFKRYRHNDLTQLAQLLENPHGGRKLVVTDAVFSMGGDIAALSELLVLCERHDAWLLVDDAHGFGVLGEQGRGSLSHFGLVSPRIIYMATLGKAAGVSGAFVAAEQVVIDTLLQTARSYIYTTASPPALACALMESVQLVRDEEGRRTHLRELIRQLKKGLAGLKWELLESVTPIQPLVIGGNEEAVSLSESLRARGIWVPAIRPPTVPQGTARLRISLSAVHSTADVNQLTEALHELAR